MAPVAGPSRGGIANVGTSRSATTRSTSGRAKTNKRVEQERIVDRLLRAFLSERTQDPTRKAAQKAKAVHTIDKDSWSPADADEIASAIQGLSLKHSIHLDHELSLALRRCHAELLVSCDRSMHLADQARDSYKRRGLDTRHIHDPLIRPDNVSDAVRLLLLLSKPPDVTARTAANLMLNATHPARAQYLTPEQRRQAEKREWLSILVDEPLQGDAWMEHDDEHDNSDLSDWSQGDDDDHERRRRLELEYDSDKEDRRRRARLAAASSAMELTPATTAKMQQRDRWTEQRSSRADALHKLIVADVRNGPKTWTEVDAVRESLSALMGCSSAMYVCSDAGQYSLAEGPFAPSSLFLGISEQMQDVATLASTFNTLRHFVNATVTQSIHAVDALTRTPAVEAFAEQLQILLERLSLRLSELDADLASISSSKPQPLWQARYSTMLQLVGHVHHEASSLLLLSRLLHSIGFIAIDDRSTHAGIGAGILRSSSDRALIDGLQALLNFAHQQDTMAVPETVVADLSRCLLAACRPAWSSVCQLIRRGLSFAIMREDDPLFDDRLVQHLVKHDVSLATSDKSFWTSGYRARQALAGGNVDEDTEDGYSPPAFLQSIADDVITTSKGVGLLRSLGIDALGEVQPDSDLRRILNVEILFKVDHTTKGLAVDNLPDDDEDADATQIQHATRSLTGWEARSKLRRILFPHGTHSNRCMAEELPLTPDSQPDADEFWHGATAGTSRSASLRLLEPRLGRSLRQHLSPISAIVRKRLIEVLTSPAPEGGYALQSHLEACHGLLFMQRGAEISSWTESLFLDLDRRNGAIRAIEPSRLTSGFHDCMEDHQQRTAGRAWIDTSLVRFHKGDDDRDMRAAARSRSRIGRLADIRVEYDVPWPLSFVFPPECTRFHQSIFTSLLQAKYAHWKLASTVKLARPETLHMRKYWSLRRQAQWLVRTLIEFVQRDVVLDGSERLCVDLQGVVSLDDAIQTHTAAVAKMEMLCFHRADQSKVKELFDAAWRLGVDVVSTYELFIGASGRNEERLARRKRRERRRKRRDRAKQDGAPLDAIAEADEEEEEEEEAEEQEEDDDDEAAEELNLDRSIGEYEAWGAQPDAYAKRSAYEGFDASMADASMSADVSASWIESETHKREHFRIECERLRKALQRLVEELTVRVDEQIARIAATSALEAQDASQADHALHDHHYTRQRWQGLLYSLAWSDLTY